MRMIAVRPSTVVTQYRMSVIFSSEGFELRFTFWVVWARMSSMGDARNAPPSVIPPRVDFFRKFLRLFSGAKTSCPGCTGCSSFNPSFCKNFCDGVMRNDLYVNEAILYRVQVEDDYQVRPFINSSSSFLVMGRFFCSDIHFRKSCLMASVHC